MKTGTKLAHPSQCREVSNPAEIERLLAQNWCELKKPVNLNARKQRQFRLRCKLLGYRRFTAYLPQDVFDELTAVKLPNETQAELITRLLHGSGDIPIVVEDN